MTQNGKPVLRFAPSPTGYLHIGGARTALFNWLYARHTGGKFLLRIEDTDRQRSTPQAIAAILDGLSWLELNADEEPVYQFSRAPRHREIAEQLLAQGNAYRCYATPEELEEMRAARANWNSGSPSHCTPSQESPSSRAATAASVERSRSVSSMRSRNLPPVWRA